MLSMQMPARGIQAGHEPRDRRPIERDPVPSYNLHNQDNFNPIHTNEHYRPRVIYSDRKST